eukprot:TRINITY_DN4695_c0_g1_i1.p1 TRINITY_DN4695_c0_g1~~TRINITY_DN4695_c0_g1_i1.p1  ORF type:complete len:482 (+),score=88.53 TRINITY_DN4695_c0_g1_i1:31-1446(+)
MYQSLLSHQSQFKNYIQKRNKSTFQHARIQSRNQIIGGYTHNRYANIERVIRENRQWRKEYKRFYQNFVFGGKKAIEDNPDIEIGLKDFSRGPSVRSTLMFMMLILPSFLVGIYLFILSMEEEFQQRQMFHDFIAHKWFSSFFSAMLRPVYVDVITHLHGVDRNFLVLEGMSRDRVDYSTVEFLQMLEHPKLREELLEKGLIERLITNSNGYMKKYANPNEFPGEPSSFEDIEKIWTWEGVPQLFYQLFKEKENLFRVLQIDDVGSHLLKISERNPPAVAVIIALLSTTDEGKKAMDKKEFPINEILDNIHDFDTKVMRDVVANIEDNLIDGKNIDSTPCFEYLSAPEEGSGFKYTGSIFAFTYILTRFLRVASKNGMLRNFSVGTTAFCVLRAMESTIGLTWGFEWMEKFTHKGTEFLEEKGVNKMVVLVTPYALEALPIAIFFKRNRFFLFPMILMGIANAFFEQATRS